MQREGNADGRRPEIGGWSHGGEVNEPETQRQTEDTGRIRSIKWDKYSKAIQEVKDSGTRAERNSAMGCWEEHAA